MKLSHVIDQLVAERPVEEGTESQYRRAADRFGRSIGRPATVADLSPESVNRWLQAEERAYTKSYALYLKRGLTRAWNYAAEIDLCAAYSPKRLRRIQPDPPRVQPWSLAQLYQLLEACDEIRGSLRIGIAGSDLIRAVIWIGYDTGIRPGDQLRLLWDGVDLEAGRLALVQNKTKNAHVAALGPGAIEALRAIRLPERDRVVPLGKHGLRKWTDQLFRIAESRGFRRRKGQGIGTLRKTHGTEVAREHGIEAAAQSLGHISGTAIARRHYVAAEVLANPVLPARPRMPLKRGRENASKNRSGSRAGARTMRATG